MEKVGCLNNPKDNCGPIKDGDIHCIFHKPKKNKRESKEFYNMLIEKAELLFTETHSYRVVYNTNVDWKNYIFPALDTEINLKNGSTLEEPFYRAKFHGNVNLLGATFEGEINFVESDFYGRANFSQAKFSGGSLAKAKFHSGADFSGTTFHRDFNFNGTIFNKDTTFLGATFLKETKTIKEAKAYFVGAVFNELANFVQATFGGTANFRNSIFKSWTNFRATTFKDASFKSAQFDSEALFGRALFCGEANFCEVNFCYKTGFELTEFNSDVLFSRATIKNNALFIGTNFKGEAFFDGTIFENTSYFILSKFEKGLNFRNACFHQGVIMELDWQNPETNKYRLSKAEQEGCRVQKLSYEKEGVREAADHLYVREMRARQNSKIEEKINQHQNMILKTNHSESFLLRKYPAWRYTGSPTALFYKYQKKSIWGAYISKWTERLLIDATCRYGTDWCLLIKTSLSIILIFSLFYFLPTFLPCLGSIKPIDGNINIWERYAESLYFSIVTFSTVGCGNISPEGSMRFVAGIQSLIGSFFIALFVVVFARRWMR